MTGSYLGSSPKVLAKQPFSVVYTRPPGISAMKSSWAGLLPSWEVKVVVVLPVPDRNDLAAGVQGQAAATIDDVVPHPQAALLGLAEVVRVEHAGDVGVQVDGDEPVVRVAGGGYAGRVDDGGVRHPGGRVVALPGRVVELVLHAGHVRVGRLHDQPGPGAEPRIGSDIAVDHDHVG